MNPRELNLLDLVPSVSDFNGQTLNYKQHGASCLNSVPLSIKKRQLCLTGLLK